MDGRVHWLRWEVQPWRESMGDVAGIVIFSEDITASKQAEEALQESESRLKRAQAVAHVGNWELDIDASMIWCSEEALRIYGFSTESNWFEMPNFEFEAKSPISASEFRRDSFPRRTVAFTPPATEAIDSSYPRRYISFIPPLIPDRFHRGKNYGNYC